MATASARHQPTVFPAHTAAALLSLIAVATVSGPCQSVKQDSLQSRDGRLPQARVVREIDDPHTGDRWLLVIDFEDRGGPGRMVLAGKLNKNAMESPANGLYGVSMPAENSAVIRAGDHVVVEENLPKVNAHLEALALENASAGAQLNVRLAIGSKLVRVTAVDRGKAILTDPKESWR